jgi:hypothetical protein
VLTPNHEAGVDLCIHQTYQLHECYKVAAQSAVAECLRQGCRSQASRDGFTASRIPRSMLTPNHEAGFDQPLTFTPLNTFATKLHNHQKNNLFYFYRQF